MAVFTEVSHAEAAKLLHALQLGDLIDLQGCAGGIENTNYFASTQLNGQRHEHVLTLFERLGFEQLPFYLHLMKHLAGKGIPVPDPAADAKGQLLHKLKDLGQARCAMACCKRDCQTKHQQSTGGQQGQKSTGLFAGR